MNTSTMNTLSTVAISVGSFLLGGSLGLALNDCRSCAAFSYYENLEECEGDDEGDILRPIISEETLNEMKQNARDFYASLDPRVDDGFDEETFAEYKRQTKAYDIISEDNELDEDDESYTADIKEIEVGGETIQVKNTEYGYEELGEPYVISRDSFENEYQDFAKESLVYFEDDDVLSTDKDEIIKEREKVIGTEALNSFGEGSDDEDIVYVRNLALSIDYEVVLEHQSYQENVMGLLDENDQKYKDALKFFGLDKKE